MRHLFPEQVPQFLFIFFLCFPPFLFAQSLFQHGVASGDPLANQVIIWTRITPSSSAESIEGEYFVFEDKSATRLISKGEFTTNSNRDYTVKIDVDGLAPATTYYYYFSALGANSDTGRTRTAPKENVEQLKFAVVSCNNYEQGYFHGYRSIAQKLDLDAVIHLGDYIYESYSGSQDRLHPPGRQHDPPHELLTVPDYRKRYAQYRKDPDLQAAHKQHPFIVIWDDHETSNNANRTGAQGHQEEDGDWEERKACAQKVYFEWMPIRESKDSKIYRKISFGKLADLILLDTRIEGRDPQIYDATDTSVYNKNRTLLGETQRNWMLSQLKNSSTSWKMIGNQVVFSPLYGRHIGSFVENGLMDTWDGYPAERLAITKYIRESRIEDIVFLTGDIHSSLAFDVPVDDWNYPLTEEECDYDVKTGANAVAVEFVTPSISSYSIDEFVRFSGKLGPLKGMSRMATSVIENKFQKNRVKNKQGGKGRRTGNPHLKYINMRDHGYLVLTLTPSRAQADYYHVKKAYKSQAKEKLAGSFYTLRGTSKLVSSPVKNH